MPPEDSFLWQSIREAIVGLLGMSSPRLVPSRRKATSPFFEHVFGFGGGEV